MIIRATDGSLWDNTCIELLTEVCGTIHVLITHSPKNAKEDIVNYVFLTKLSYSSSGSHRLKSCSSDPCQ